MPIFDDKDFPISVVRKSILQGTGIDMEEAKQKPLIAVASSMTEINPGHMHLSSIAQRVKEGVFEAGGLPFEFNVPAPCDGVTEGHEGMRFVLAQRDLIADIIETHTRSMLYDGIVFVASCDKIIPGMLMAAARLDLPSIFVTGGPNSWEIRFRSGKKEAADHKYYTDLGDKLACATAATCGSCELMGTANTMQSLTEALGMALPRSATVPAFHSDKLRFARAAGRRVVQLIEAGITARKVMTRAALENAVMVDLAIGGSTNSTLHLPAIAHECGFELPLSVFNDFNKRVPTLCAISPSGPFGIIDLYAAGGIPAVMSRIADSLNTDAVSVAGSTIGEIARGAFILDETIIPERTRPYQPEGGTAVLFGNLAPDGAVVKQSAVTPEMRVFSGKARVFDSESDCLRAIREKAIREGDVVVIRYEGPMGGPGMAETLAVTMGIEMAGYRRVALVTDGRFSGASAGPCIGHVSPEACAGGPLAAVRDGDEISIDIPKRSLQLDVPDDEIKSRMRGWKPPEKQIPPGYMRRYVKLVGPASRGAVLG
jgi:dihydroxy-acid dehydratase